MLVIASALVIAISFIVFLTENAVGQSLFYDDFDGNQLDESNWEVVQWQGEVEVEVADSKAILSTTQGARAGILSVPTFNADNAMVSVTIKGTQPDPQLIFGLYFGEESAWENTVEIVSGEGAGNEATSVWIMRRGGDFLEIGPQPRPVKGLANEMTIRKDGNSYTFIQKFEDADDFVFETDIDDFKGDFRVLLYAYNAGNSKVDSVCVYTGEKYPASPQAVYPGDKIAITLGEIKVSR